MATDCTDYEPRKIEPHWQAYWEKQDCFRAEDSSDKPKYYAMEMYPYPSGAGLHLGHFENNTAVDILARFKKGQGCNVLRPMGWDAFGLPTEQAAIKTGAHPVETTKTNVGNMKRQMKEAGWGIDWSREINTTDPAYYRWTQWIFLKLFQHGLAYVEERPVWWCEALKTVLANEEVIDGRSERGNHPVERKNLRQWVLRITAYADRLLEGLKELDWPDSTKRQQTAWIGRSTGAEVTFPIDGHPNDDLLIYTTRPDTLFGATYMVLAPEHALVDKITTAEQMEAVVAYREAATKKSDLDRTDLAKEKSGVFTGAFAINPVNQARIPIWVADYVLISYGTGAIMAVPAHDERDFEFAETFNLPIQQVIEKPHGESGNGAATTLPYSGPGVMVHSDGYTGMAADKAKEKITADLEAKGVGKAAINFKLRDWLFSRQRYWGEPFPIVWVDEAAYKTALEAGGAVASFVPDDPVTFAGPDGLLYALPVPDGQLPVVLPEVESYQPVGADASPLGHAPVWLEVWLNVETGETVSALNADQPDGPWVRGRRETNTMPQWAGSCWYYLRYMDPENAEALVDPEKEAYWKNADFYIGGAEHAVLHLLYARFWHHFLHDIGAVSTPEPFPKLFHQGIITGTMEYTAFRNAKGNRVSAERVDYKIDKATLKEEPSVSLTLEKVDEEDVEKKGDAIVLKTEPEIQVDARSQKMSKSLGNVVNPDDVIGDWGADALRLYIMFMGPLEDMKPWSPSGIKGIARFLDRLWRLIVERDGSISKTMVTDGKEHPDTLRALHQTIKKVTEDTGSLAYNTAISQMMILLNQITKSDSVQRSTIVDFLRLLAPYAPHFCEELWERMGEKPSIMDAGWPVADESALASAETRIVFQVNGKVRGEAMVDPAASQEEVMALAQQEEKVARQLEGKTVRKVIFVPGKILNIVAG